MRVEDEVADEAAREFYAIRGPEREMGQRGAIPMERGWSIISDE